MLFYYINNLAGKSGLLDIAMIFCAKYLIVLMFAYAAAMIIAGKSRKAFILSLISAAIGLVLNLLAGMLYFHQRPFAAGPANQLISHAPDNSFPSDHTTLSLSMSICLLLKGRKEGIPFALLSLLIGFSRIFCGVHYPIDILGSIIISLVSSLITCKILERKIIK